MSEQTETRPLSDTSRSPEETPPSRPMQSTEPVEVAGRAGRSAPSSLAANLEQDEWADGEREACVRVVGWAKKCGWHQLEAVLAAGPALREELRVAKAERLRDVPRDKREDAYERFTEDVCVHCFYDLPVTGICHCTNDE